MTASILVTGGFGFIGSHTVQALLRSGERVVVIDRLVSGNAAELVLSPDERRAVEVVATEVPAADALAALLRHRGVDRIAHLASPLSSVTETQPHLVVDEMVVPHRAILDAAIETGVRRVVWASSVGVFGRSSDYPCLPIDDDAHHQPLTLYGAAKSFLEHLSSRYASTFGLDIIGLRFPLVYGPGRQRGGGQFTTRLIEGAGLGGPIVADGSDDRYDWMYVTDTAHSVQLALGAAPTPTRVFTVSGEVATVGDVADLLRGWFPDAERSDEPGSSDLVADYDGRRAEAELGYLPQTSLREGVLATVNAARARAGLPAVS